LPAEFRAVEHAVMSDVALKMMMAHGVRDSGAQSMRRLGLSDAGNVVILAFDREQGDFVDGAGIDRLAAMGEPPARQIMANEDPLHRIKEEFGSQVHHCHVLVIELAMLLDRKIVILDLMQEEVAMGADMPVEVHRHEARKLQESGIDQPPKARIGP